MPNLNDSIDEIKRFQENLNKAAETNDDVKAGISTPEEEKEEPEFQMYDVIAETTIKILQNEHVVNTFNELAKKVGDELTKSIIESISIMMTNSAFNAILWYDKLMEKNIVPQFNALVEKVNMLDADVTGYGGAIRVLKEKVSLIEKQSQINNLNN